MTKTNEEWVEEFRKFRTEEISEMFDNVDENGIYPTGKFFIKLDSYVAQLLEAKDKEREEAVAEVVEEVNRSWREDPMTIEHHAKIIAEAVADIIKMADALELECGLDGDKGTKQWMAFKGFRNTIRDKYLTPPLTK